MNGRNNSLGLTPQQLRAFEVFSPHAYKKTIEAVESRQRFVHYTSADTVLKIIRLKEVWLRKATCMNDFSEIEYGRKCLNQARREKRNEFEAVFDKMFPHFTGRLVDKLNDWFWKLGTDTYITCFSEHHTKEDFTGRLSMWRAYGGDAGVAVVLNPTVFLTPSDALGAYTSPVAYLSEKEFCARIEDLLKGVRANAEFLRSLGEQAVFDHMFSAFRLAILCTKHPGFGEELEWRVICSPGYQPSARIERQIESVNGIPQPVCKIKLEDVPEEGLIGAAIPDLVERIIIGPTKHPDVMREAFVDLLKEIGVSSPESRVFASDIPLRR